MNTDAPDIRADPPLDTWASRLLMGPIDEDSVRFRRELGLPTDGPIVMSGHQPIFWHPGILVKYMAAEALAAATGGACAHFVVDQDEVDPFAIDIPVRTEGGALSSRTLRLAPEPAPGLSASSLKPGRPLSLDDSTPHALPEIADRIGRLTQSLAAYTDEPNAAKQVVKANAALLEPVLPERPTVYASELHQTTLFGELLDRMTESPREAVASYNEAVRAVPEAKLTPLAMNEDEEMYELPLWSIAPGEPRRRVYHHDLESIDRSKLAPRALLATAAMRLAGCELFVHGTGGAVYDRATERWIGAWLSAKLAPSVSITADVRLPLAGETVSADVAHHARWLAHSARHNPGLIGKESAQHAKERLLAKISDARSRGEDPRPFYREIHDNRRTFEFAHADELHGLRARAERLERLHAESGIASRRDWASVLYGDDQLGEMIAQIREAISSGTEAGSDQIKPSRTKSPR